jgi:hypothetical protein
MYNGIGLQTPRGSGTSGHIQTNVSINQKKLQSREQFLIELEAKRVSFLTFRTPTMLLHARQILKS